MGCPLATLSDDLEDKAALNTKAAFQTRLGGKKQHLFLGPGLGPEKRP